jgi:SAM-dependent methyltransferase
MDVQFVCPLCKNPLSGLSCSLCGASFSSVSDIPSFICRQMYVTDEDYSAALRIIDFWGNGWEKRFQEPDHIQLFQANRDELRELVEQDKDFHRQSNSVMPLLRDQVAGKTALNIGCGAGSEALVLASNGAKCIAMDITMPAARAAEQLVGVLGGECIGVQADSRYLPLEDCSVDLVYSSGVLHHSPSIEKSIAEIYRVLKPGGKAFIMLYATWSVLFVQQRLMRSMGEGAWETGVRKNPHTTTYTLGECRRLFSQFTIASLVKTGEALKHLAIVGRYVPEFLDRPLYSFLGPCINIVAVKPEL